MSETISKQKLLKWLKETRITVRKAQMNSSICGFEQFSGMDMMIDKFIFVIDSGEVDAEPLDMRTGDRNADSVNHPSHYNQGRIECIDALAAATINLTGIEAFDTANAIKYLWRWKEKGGVEDLRKTIWYIDHLIQLQEVKL